MKIAVLVSGGVDSSVALRLLKDQGHSVTAFYLKIWLEDELSFLGTCPWQEDLAFVEAVCKQADIPLEVISLQKEYWNTVVSYTVAQVKAGFTPNPDILCNQAIKFGSFVSKIDASFDAIATGHYAHIISKNGMQELHSAPDPIKDQAYFLSYLSQEQLKRVIFPLGTLNKSEVRALAYKYDLPNKDRKDSQGICFLGKLKFDEFLNYHLGEKKGDLIEIETGKIVGSHKGFWYYTIGQRQGLGLAGGPWYVADKDPKNNSVYISRNYYSAEKLRKQFTIHNCNWITTPPTTKELMVKLRHGKAYHACSLVLNDDGTAQVTLKDNDQGISPGQFAVFYNGTHCLGAGIIHYSHSNVPAIEEL